MYCHKLESIENNYFKDNEIIIFRYFVDENKEEYLKQAHFFKENFADLDGVPSLFWIEKGFVSNQLPIIEKINMKY